jgi:hypothetical protein
MVENLDRIRMATQRTNKNKGRVKPSFLLPVALTDVFPEFFGQCVFGGVAVCVSRFLTGFDHGFKYEE